jgi:hypothetical protein
MPKDSSRNILLRQWKILKLIPTIGSGITSRQLRDILSDLGFSVTKRQIERDLLQLQEVFSSQYVLIIQNLAKPV